MCLFPETHLVQGLILYENQSRAISVVAWVLHMTPCYNSYCRNKTKTFFRAIRNLLEARKKDIQVVWLGMCGTRQRTQMSRWSLLSGG